MSELKLSEQFLLAFAQLRNACNDNPQTLVTFLRERPEFVKLAHDVDSVAAQIELVSNFRKAHAQVSVGFIEDWKNYLYKWRTEIDYVINTDLLAGIFDDWDQSFEEFKTRDDDARARLVPNPYEEDEFRPEAHDGGAAIVGMTKLLAEQAENRRSDVLDDSDVFIANTYSLGIEALEFFEETIGIEIGRAFDRWNRLPAFFIPQHVSDNYGLTSKEGLYALLNEAIRAYVAGAPAAAVAMCRSLLEMVLREHYLPRQVSEFDKLNVVIELAAAKYDFLDKKRLDGLRKDANRVLHNFSGIERLTLADERVVLSFFKDLKFYIERAPERGKAK